MMATWSRLVRDYGTRTHKKSDQMGTERFGHWQRRAPYANVFLGQFSADFSIQERWLLGIPIKWHKKGFDVFFLTRRRSPKCKSASSFLEVYRSLSLSSSSTHSHTHTRVDNNWVKKHARTTRKKQQIQDEFCEKCTRRQSTVNCP